MALAVSVREPLTATTNNSNSPPPSPPSSMSKPVSTELAVGSRAVPSTDVPILRRKATLQKLVNLDSSESLPSLHSSLYEASVESSFTSANHADDDAWIHDRTEVESPAWANLVFDNTGRPVPVSFLQPTVHPKMHIPHKLCTITEQTSLATLHASLRASSLGNHPSTMTLRSSRSRSPGLNGMRQKSFSVSDLPPPQAANELTSNESPFTAAISPILFPNKPTLRHRSARRRRRICLLSVSVPFSANRHISSPLSFSISKNAEP